MRQVIEQTGLTADQVQAAMREDGNVHRCATTIALLKATMDWHGAERHAILMTL